MKPVLDTLSSLVSINSINPEWGGPGEAAMADFVETFFAESGLEVIRDEVLPGRCNVMVCLPGQDRSRSVVLESHMDTVSADGMTINPLEPRIEEGLLYGRGSCDTKAGLAGMMHAVRWFVETGSTPPCDVYLAAVVDEEHIFRGVLGALEWFKKKGVQPEAAVVSEPTELRLVRANKGVLRWKIETKGVSAHSSKPHLGKNAITKMAEVILKIEKHHESLRKQEHSLLGNSTCSIVVIEGGEQMTETVNRMDEALSVIDTGLSHLQSREIIAASEVADLLLDLRLLLMQVEAPTTPVLSP